MQGLQELWGLPLGQNSWATSGYLGAINSGDTTCGLLIGSSVAIGMRTGHGKKCLPLADEDARNKAIAEVNSLFEDFIHEFQATQCENLVSCDFSKPEEGERYLKEEIYRHKCFNFFNFIMNRFFDSEEMKAGKKE